MNKLLVFFLLTFLPTYSYSQNNSSIPEDNYEENKIWYDGQVVFKEGDTVNCLLSYEPLKTRFILHINDGNEIFAYNPKVISSFSYFDTSLKKERRFESFIPEQNNMVFIEILFKDSDFSIIRQETIFLKVKTYSGYSYPGTPALGGIPQSEYKTASVKEMDKLFILDEKQSKLYALSKRKLIHLTKLWEKEIVVFIKRNNLKLEEDVDHLGDYKRVIQEYHRLNDVGR
jgi:hypothetical protein